MNTSLRLTGKHFTCITSLAENDIKCTMNESTDSFTVANDKLISLGLYEGKDLIGFVGRNGLVKDYREAELINGRYEPCVLGYRPNAHFKKDRIFLPKSKRRESNKTTQSVVKPCVVITSNRTHLH